MWLHAADWFGLLPNWSFFAPRPGITDQRIWFRDASPDGEVGAWRETLDLGRPWHAAAFNHQRRWHKVKIDAIQKLLQYPQIDKVHMDRRAQRGVRLTFSYLCLANFALRAAPLAVGSARQFAIVQHYPLGLGRRPDVIFRSDFHRK